jgi:hypothetical protein
LNIWLLLVEVEVVAVHNQPLVVVAEVRVGLERGRHLR